MIKFFRTIRRELLSQNRITKYLVYAVGEIVLVVLGILIALQINNWNQERIDNLKETTYLRNLQKELQSNIALNQRLITDRMQRKMEGLMLAKKYCERINILADTLGFLNKVTFGGVSSGGVIFGSRDYFDELLSSGNLQIIKKDSIKNSMASYYRKLDMYNNRSQVHSSRFSSYTSELRPFNRENSSHISKYDQAEMMESFKSEEFRKLVDLEITYAYTISAYCNTLETNARNIIELINKELDDKM